jgi:hypothetical protein
MSGHSILVLNRLEGDRFWPDSRRGTFPKIAIDGKEEGFEIPSL